MVTYLGSLVQLCCGEGGTLQTISLACAGSACIVWTTLGLPPFMVPVLSLSTLLRLQVALQGNCLKRVLGCVHFPGRSCSGSGSRVLQKGTYLVGPAFCALPRSEQLRQPGAWRVYSPQVGRCILSPPWSWPLSFPVLSGSTVSGVPCVSSGELISGCDPPGGCQPSRIPGRLGEQLGACSQFDRGCCLWGRICPFLSGSGWHLPASLPLAGMGQSTAG